MLNREYHAHQHVLLKIDTKYIFIGPLFNVLFRMNTLEDSRQTMKMDKYTNKKIAILLTCYVYTIKYQISQISSLC